MVVRAPRDRRTLALLLGRHWKIHPRAAVWLASRDFQVFPERRDRTRGFNQWKRTGAPYSRTGRRMVLYTSKRAQGGHWEAAREPCRAMVVECIRPATDKAYPDQSIPCWVCGKP